MTAATEALSRVDLFTGFSADVLAALADQTSDRAWDAGELVAEQGSPNDGLLVISEGSLEVRRGSRVLKVLESGDWVGDMSLIDGGPHSVDVKALTPGRGVFLDGGQFRVAIKHYPDAAMSIMKVLVARIRETLMWLDEADSAGPSELDPQG